MFMSTNTDALSGKPPEECKRNFNSNLQSLCDLGTHEDSDPVELLCSRHNISRYALERMLGLAKGQIHLIYGPKAMRPVPTSVGLRVDYLVMNPAAFDEQFAEYRVERDSRHKALIEKKGGKFTSLVGRPVLTRLMEKEGVKAFMTQWNIKINELAKMFDVSPSFVRNWTTGAARVPNDKAQRMLKFAGQVSTLGDPASFTMELRQTH